LITKEAEFLGGLYSRGIRNLEMSPDEKRKSVYGEKN
jgi:hypothetical protein